MFTRVLMSAVVGVSLVAGLGSDAEGHYAGYQTINGYLRHVSSFDCGIKIKGVSNLTQHPALFKCDAIVTRFEILCQNPQDHNVVPGESATQTTFSVNGLIETENIIDKKKGRAEKFIHIDDAVQLLKQEFCVNPNWHPLQVLSTNVTVRYSTYDCQEDTCASELHPPQLAYYEDQECVLPGFDQNGNPPPVGTLYTCRVLGSQHVF
jgi:hypothetical protein